MKDILGTALLDYFHGNYSEDILTETNISEEDVLPLPYLFRDYAEMPALEQTALTRARGNVLDVGCGAGSHALYLQKKGLEVTAIDRSEGAVEVAKLRGVEKVILKDVMQMAGRKFDTLLILMNGAGILKSIAHAKHILQHLKTLLAPNGQILIDSSDLQYMYDSSEDGGIWVPGDHYYGELEFVMKYKGEESEPFPWLYLDELRFEQLCKLNQLKFEVVARGDHFDFLARITT